MASKITKKPALGKGLGALLKNDTADFNSSNPRANSSAVALLAISQIEANPFNPRTNFEKEALEELASSIKIHGIIQPLTVRKNGSSYQLISGERRFRASQLAGLKEIPAYIRTADDQAMLEMALVENIQREDLNAIEVALSYQRLMDECALTQELLAQKVAKSRASIANHLRLLKLPAEIQLGVRDNIVSMGHARAIVSAGTEEMQLAIYRQVIDNQMSVRETEDLIRNFGKEQKAPLEKKTEPDFVLELSGVQETFQNHLSDRISSKVEIKKTNLGNGKITIPFSSEVDLNRIISLLSK